MQGVGGQSEWHFPPQPFYICHGRSDLFEGMAPTHPEASQNIRVVTKAVVHAWPGWMRGSTPCQEMGRLACHGHGAIPLYGRDQAFGQPV